MTAYLFVTLDIKDKFLAYAAAARDLVPRFGGRYLSTACPAGALEGSGVELPMVLSALPTAEHIRAF